MTNETTISCGSTADAATPVYLRWAERCPGGRSNRDRHSPLSPWARESSSLPQGSARNSNNQKTEGGRIELRRVSPRLTAYKAASAPNGLRLPYEGPAGSRTQFSATARGAAGRLPPGPLTLLQNKPGAWSARSGSDLLFFAVARGEAEGLQPIVGCVDYAPVLESDFRAEYSPICGFGTFGSKRFCHSYLAMWTQNVHWLGWQVPSRPLVH